MKYASAVHNAHVMRVSQKETKQKSALVNNLVQYMYVWLQWDGDMENKMLYTA